MPEIPPPPFNTRREAHDFALEYGGPPAEGEVILSLAQKRQMLARACTEAGVELGDYDGQFLGWLAGWEDYVCAVVVSLILRVRKAGERNG